MEEKITFIVQSRLGSTRLPNKILLPFFEGKNILSIIIDKLKSIPDCRVILATTNNHKDDPLIDFAAAKEIPSFRGSEDDVLQRFIDAAHCFNAQKIIRVCSDNPFLDIESLKELARISKQQSDNDYISYLVNEKPSIRTHFGFWTEYVTLNALKKVQVATQESIYHEHVTNYIYTHPNDFKIEWLKTPKVLQGREDIRLTIDTEQDFIDAQEIYKYYVDRNMTIQDLVNYIDKDPRLIEKMKKEIKLNSK